MCRKSAFSYGFSSFVSSTLKADGTLAQLLWVEIAPENLSLGVTVSLNIRFLHIQALPRCEPNDSPTLLKIPIVTQQGQCVVSMRQNRHGCYMEKIKILCQGESLTLLYATAREIILSHQQLGKDHFKNGKLFNTNEHLTFMEKIHVIYH